MKLLNNPEGIIIGCSTGRSAEEPRRALVKIAGSHDISGMLTIEQASADSPVKVRGVIYGLEKGSHGLHVHQGVELGDKCQDVGQHFNPHHRHHGGPRDRDRHAGDLGNFQVFICFFYNIFLIVQL